MTSLTMKYQNDMAHQRLSILDVWVDAVSREAASDQVRSWLRHGTRPHTVLASNPEKNFSVPADQELYQTFRDADLLLPDGIGMVMAARLLCGIKLERVPGSEFIFDICRLAREGSYGVYVYGAKEWVNQTACTRLQQRYPGLRLVGRANGYVPREDMPRLVDDINACRADILFLALGSPRQEKWMATYARHLTTVKVCQGVGGTLDTIAGNVRRAPPIWCRYNLEWFYRLLKEPKRIRRQKVLPLFALAVLRECLARRRPLAT